MEAVLERERRLSARPGATRPDLRTRALRTDIEQRAPFPVVAGGCFTPGLNAEAAGARSAVNRKNASDGACPHAG